MNLQPYFALQVEIILILTGILLVIYKQKAILTSRNVIIQINGCNCAK